MRYSFAAIAATLALVATLAVPALAQERPAPRWSDRDRDSSYRQAQIEAHGDQLRTNGWLAYRKNALLSGRDVVGLPTFDQMIDSDRTRNTMIIRLKDGAGDEVFEEIGVQARRKLTIVDGLYRVFLRGSGLRNGGPSYSDDAFATMLEVANAHPSVLYAEPEYRGLVAAVPNDPGDGVGIGASWWLDEINAFEAWDVATSALAIGPIMVFDTRPEVTHPDLVDNLWTNPFEIAGNGTDDDGNGHVDDIHGVNLAGVGRSHGTGSAGTACATGDNGLGYAGSAWECELLLYATAGTFSEYADALAYAVANGSRISNHSWGTLSASQSLADAIDAAEEHDHLLVVAAHNFDRDLDAEPIYPASLTNANILTVAASGPAGVRRDYSNWGATSVDIAAPADFATTTPAGYGDFGGTSQAAPLVTGAVALLWAQVPAWSAADVKAHVLATSAASPAWHGLTTTGGVIDMGAMLAAVGPSVGPTPDPETPTPPPTPVSPSTPSTGLLTSGEADDAPGDEAPSGVVATTADGSVLRVVTCLAANGRVDTTIVNTGDAIATFRVEFGQLSPRERTIAPSDWWRMPVTGRPDGAHDLRVLRDGEVLLDTAVTVNCDGPTPRVTEPEVHVVNTCRDGNGYILFQLTNPTTDVRSWIIEFEGVTNRSTSAAPAGAAVRSVTGRPDGDYEVRVRSGAEIVSAMTLTVECD